MIPHHKKKEKYETKSYYPINIALRCFTAFYCMN